MTTDYSGLRALPTPDWNQWNDWLSLIRDVLPVSTTRSEVVAAWDAFDHLRTAFRRGEAGLGRSGP